MHCQLEASEELLKFMRFPLNCTQMTLAPELATKATVSLIARISIIIPFNQEGKISFSIEKMKRAIDRVFSDYELLNMLVNALWIRHRHKVLHAQEKGLEVHYETSTELSDNKMLLQRLGA